MFIDKMVGGSLYYVLITQCKIDGFKNGQFK